MSDSNLIEPVSPPTPASREIKLWSPKNIFWLGFFLGWPTSLVLCIINWFRMGLRKKAFIFSGGGLVAMILFFTASMEMPESSSRFPLVILNLLLLASLQSLMNNDFTSLGYTSASYRPAGIGWGILVGVLTLAAIFASIFIIVILVELVKMIFTPAPFEVLPGKEGWIGVPLL